MPEPIDFGPDIALLAAMGVPAGSRGYQIFCVDPYSGSDGQPGTLQFPMRTLAEAYGRCLAGRGDSVVLVGGPRADASTGMTCRLTETLTWAKNYTNLIGTGAPTRYGQRSRITGPSTGGTFSPVMTVSANGCRFVNFTIFDDYTVDPVAMKVTGQRNYFQNVSFQGMGAATGADDAAGASLWLSGGSENTFVDCTIGLDTIPRSTTNGEILFDTAAARNFFKDCEILSYSDNAGHLFVKASSAGNLDRENIFMNCIFANAPTGHASGTTMTQCMNLHASAGGVIILHNCTTVGATDIAAADNGNVISGPGIQAVGTATLGVAVTR